VGGVLGACGLRREKGFADAVQETGGWGDVHVSVTTDVKSCRCQNSCVLRAAMVQNRFM